ncbi:transposase family protein [Pseudomonas sp. TCU-HL1]|uniref:transposase family protein n=1 Tax=Pseudomonas sp. TCU-HL1 TaxID=1856685 RepID=UPI000856B5C8|nr:transposase family protein [Pseudomonas sp. TCU-HL1]AOE85938.1 hypothetical protein THL1_3390 [Pseudomonas sp. TCU-HL1]
MNKQFEIHTGERYRYYGKPYEVQDIRNNRIQLRSINNSRTIIFQSYERLQISHQKGNFIKFQEAPFSQDDAQILESLSEKNKQKLKRIHFYVKSLLDEFDGHLPRKASLEFINKLASEINDPHPFGYTTLYKRLKAYKASNRNLFSLLDPIRQRRNRIERWNLEIRELLNHYLDLFYLRAPHTPMSDVIAAVIESAQENNERRPIWDQIKIPSISTLYRIIKEIDPLEIKLKQKGRTTATRQHKFSRKYNEPLRLYEQSEDDSHTFDTVAVDKFGRVIGRPHTTGVLIVAARYVLGYDLSFNAPSHAKTVRALKHSLRNDRKYTGLADRYILDNGPDFESVQIRERFYQLGAEVTYCAPYVFEEKPHIESWFKILVIQFSHQLAGTTFSNIKERGEYDSETEATYTLDQLRELFDAYLENYHNQPHRSLNNLSPNQVMEQMQAEQLPPRRYSPEQLDSLFRSQTSSCVVNGRVTYKYLQWTGPGVARIGSFLKKGQEALIYYDESELGQVTVCHPTKPGLSCVADAVDPDYQCGLTMYTHDQVRKKLKEAAKEFSIREAIQARMALLIKISQGNSKHDRKQNAIQEDFERVRTAKNLPPLAEEKIVHENTAPIPLVNSPPSPPDNTVVEVAHAPNRPRNN